MTHNLDSLINIEKSSAIIKSRVEIGRVLTRRSVIAEQRPHSGVQRQREQCVAVGGGVPRRHHLAGHRRARPAQRHGHALGGQHQPQY